ncbi:hypothetical protein SK128_002519 [Halocaridina rubra]|uniref:Uncharacterized protein n=1 Tax=Halocaridina rubra TaxID=373956 RepID=A0AAN8ZUM5_HALRR
MERREHSGVILGFEDLLRNEGLTNDSKCCCRSHGGAMAANPTAPIYRNFP